MTMRAVIQRVRRAHVEVDGAVVGQIEAGLLVYVGVAATDTGGEAERMAEKITKLRVFEDENGKLNHTVQDVRGGVLAVPNFTLLADARKGSRPSFVAAAPAQHAEGIFDNLVDSLRGKSRLVAHGRFGGHMIVDSEADGPVNIILEIPAAIPNTERPQGRAK